MNKCNFYLGKEDIQLIGKAAFNGNKLFIMGEAQNYFKEGGDIFLIPCENEHMIQLCRPNDLDRLVMIIENTCPTLKNGRVLKRFYLSRIIQTKIGDRYSIELPESYYRMLNGYSINKAKIQNAFMDIGYRGLGNSEESIIFVIIRE